MTVDFIFVRPVVIGEQDECVDVGAAVFFVAARLSFQNVRAGSAPQRVVAATAKQLVVAAARNQQVSGSCGVRVCVRAVRITRCAGQSVSVQNVVAITADQHIGPDVAPQRIAVVFTKQQITRLAGCCCVGVQGVSAAATEQSLPGCTFVAAQFIVSVIAKDLIDTIATMNNVVAWTGKDHVFTRSTKGCVRTGSSVDKVCIRTAVDDVDIGSTKDNVDAVVTEYLVLSVACTAVVRITNHDSGSDIHRWDKVLPQSHIIGGIQYLLWHSVVG